MSPAGKSPYAGKSRSFIKARRADEKLKARDRVTLDERLHRASDPPPDSGDGEMDPYAALGEEIREQRVLAGVETLERIKKIQSSTRNASGRIRRGKFIAACLSLRWEGFTPRETAEILGCAWQSVTYALTQIRRDADLDAQVERLHKVVVPLAMDNAARGVMNGDKDYTLRVLDGAGVFRTHQSIKADVKQTITTLSVTLQMPAHLEGKALPLPRAGAIVGAPTLAVGLPSAQTLEGVVVESAPVPSRVSRDQVDKGLYGDDGVRD